MDTWAENAADLVCQSPRHSRYRIHQVTDILLVSIASYELLSRGEACLALNREMNQPNFKERYMGKDTGFMEYSQKKSYDRPPEERIKDFNLFHL